MKFDVLVILSFIVAVLAFIIFVGMNKKQVDVAEGKLLKWYMGSVFVSFLIGLILRIVRLDKNTHFLALDLVNNLFLTIEVYVFTTLLTAGIRFSNRINIGLAVTCFFALSAGLIFFFSLQPGQPVRQTMLMSDLLTSFELFLIAGLCVFRWKTLYKRNISIQVRASILTLGLFSYAILSIPFFCLSSYLRTSQLYVYYTTFYVVHYLSLIGLCLAIAYYVRGTQKTAYSFA